jgi:O-antigen ligase
MSVAPRARPYVAPIAVAAIALVLLVGAIVAARMSAAGLVLFGVALLGLTGAVAVRWPRAAIVVVVLSPVLDRYVVADLLPAPLGTAAHYLSEGLLLVLAVVLGVRAALDGRLVGAFRHPVTAALIAFAAIGALSALLNGVPVHVAVIGLVFTLDAAALFFLPRLVGFSLRQSLFAIGAIVSIVVGAAVVAIGQAVLSPRILGLVPVEGRFGDTARLASIFGDPNVFGAFLVLAVPFALLMAVRLPTPRLRWIAGVVAIVLFLALWLSLSRGAWIALVLGVGTVLALVDRRALVLGMLMCVVTFVVADVMPRSLLVHRAPPRPQLIDSTIDRFGAVGLGGDLRTLFVLNAIPIIRDHPLLGVGPGRYGGAVANTFETPIYGEYDTTPLFWNPKQRTVDNFWLHILVETGVLGLAALLAAAMIPGIRILRAARASTGLRHIMLGGVAAATAGMAVSSVTTMLLEANSIGFPFWFLLSIGAMVAGAAVIGLDQIGDDPAEADPS